jgi:hypothetical protein
MAISVHGDVYVCHRYDLKGIGKYIVMHRNEGVLELFSLVSLAIA